MANCCVAGSVAELLVQGCVVLQSLEQACMDVACTAVVGSIVGGWILLVRDYMWSIFLCASEEACMDLVCTDVVGSIVVRLEVWQKFSCKVVLCCKALNQLAWMWRALLLFVNCWWMDLLGQDLNALCLGEWLMLFFELQCVHFLSFKSSCGPHHRFCKMGWL